MDIYNAREIQKELIFNSTVKDKNSNIVSHTHQYSTFDDNNNLIYCVSLEVNQGFSLIINKETIDHFNDILSIGLSIVIEASKQMIGKVYITYIIRID